MTTTILILYTKLNIVKTDDSTTNAFQDYDLLFEKSGFLSNVIKTINISKDEEIDLGTQILDEGDADRSQIIDLNDMVDIMNANGYSSENPEYVEDCDFGKKGVVNLDDMVCVTQNMYKTINIKEYNN